MFWYFFDYSKIMAPGEDHGPWKPSPAHLKQYGGCFQWIRAPFRYQTSASTWDEYNGLYLACDWGLRGGMQQQGGDMQCSLPHSHHPPLLRARREIIPSCSGVTGTTEGGGRIGPIARATPPPPKREERFASPLSVGWMSCGPGPFGAPISRKLRIT